MPCAPKAPSAPGFPQHAPRVLDTLETFVSDEHGFTLATRGGSFRGFEARLPADSSEPIALQMTDGLAIRARENGAQGRAVGVAHAVGYRRAGGTSFWTAVPGGLENWLHLAPGVACGADPVASWQIAGAHVRMQGDVAELLDPTGRVRLRVTAPSAYTEDGTQVAAHSEALGPVIALRVDAASACAGAILVDPTWTAAGPMVKTRAQHAAALLQDGRVLLAGDAGGNGQTAEIYAPTTNTFSGPIMMSISGGST